MDCGEAFNWETQIMSMSNKNSVMRSLNHSNEKPIEWNINAFFWLNKYLDNWLCINSVQLISTAHCEYGIRFFYSQCISCIIEMYCLLGNGKILTSKQHRNILRLNYTFLCSFEIFELVLLYQGIEKGK